MKPLLVYDGACKFCCRRVETLRRFAGSRFDAISFREPGFFIKHSELTLEECEKSVQLISGDGARFSGAEAVSKTIALSAFWKPVLWIYYVPGLRGVWEWLYENIARNRYRISSWEWSLLEGRKK